MALSLTKKAVILVTVPVLFEIALVGTLAAAFLRTEEARKQENHAREMTGHISNIMAMHLQRVAFLALSKSEPSTAVEERIATLRTKMHGELAEVAKMQREDPDQAAKWKTLLGLAKNLDDSFAQAKLYRSEDKQIEMGLAIAKVRLYLDQLIKLSDQLHLSQNELLNQRHQELLRSSQEIQMALWAAVFGSLVIAFGLLLYFNRGTADRLSSLMKNTQLLAAGQAPLKALTGDDELAQIDRLFHQLHLSLMMLRARERTILDNAAEIICSIDEDMRFSDINNASFRLWGMSPEDLLGKRVIDLIQAEDQKSVLKSLKTASQSQKENEPIHFEAGVKKADGSISHTEWSATYSPESRSLCCVIHDISERKEIDRLKQDFVAMVSHDLRAPLTSIQMVHSLIEQDLEMQPEINPHAQRNLSMARDNVNRLMALINNLLDLDKLESGMMDLLPKQQTLLPVVQTSVDAVRAIAQKSKLTVDTCIDPALEAYFDQEKLIQVLVNLLSNAFKFSPSGSQVRIVATPAEGNEAGFVHLAVIDQGRGVPPAIHDKIFERFRQAEAADGRERKGSGLGLSICKAIVEQHRGQIGVKSQDNSGSTFWFTVPANSKVFDAVNGDKKPL